MLVPVFVTCGGGGDEQENEKLHFVGCGHRFDPGLGMGAAAGRCRAIRLWSAHDVVGGGWHGMILGPLFMTLVIAAVIALVLVFARVLGGPWHGSAPPYQTPPGRTPLDILKERFARGEIDKPEYEERRRVLGE